MTADYADVAGSQVASYLLLDNNGAGFAIMDDAVYEGDEAFRVAVSMVPGTRAGLLRFERADGTFLHEQLYRHRLPGDRHRRGGRAGARARRRPGHD